MLSPKTMIRLLLSLVLILNFSVGSVELCVAVGTTGSWALGHIILRRSALPAGHWRAFHVYLVLSFVLLAATNDLFFEQTLGRVLDVFFERCTCDPDVPGSGFTNWYNTVFRRHFALAWRFLCFATWWIIGLGALYVILQLNAIHRRESQGAAETVRAIEWLDTTGEVPPWIVEARERAKNPPAAPKRDTRYMTLGDSVIFVCGPGGGFERVIAGDYDGAISRRRGISKEFT
ncbi:hypothetical protein NX059_006532 [Plenodomus lindquistii]|nr:hypothetical protein NX059_006532 [Plenodomus lindquistii]